MSTQIEIGHAAPIAAYNVESDLIKSQTIVPSGTNQVTTLAITNAGPLLCTINPDENIFFAIGIAPDATVATARRALSAGQRVSLFYQAGQEVAVISR